MEGLYSKWPRIDKELILKHHKGLIATSCCIGASVPQAILREDPKPPKPNLNGGLICLAKIFISSCNDMRSRAADHQQSIA
jgi:DNA polymerase III alpha subunit